MKKSIIGWLLGLQLLTSISMAMVFSLAPTVTARYGIDPAYATYLNLGFVGAGLLSPIFGVWADHQGTKKVLLLGVFWFALSHGFTAFAPTAITYVLGRLSIGLGYYAVYGLIVSYLAKSVDHAHMGKVSAGLKLAFAIGVTVAPILSGLMVEWIGFEGLYLSIGGLGLLIGVNLLSAPNSGHDPDERFTWSQLKALISDPSVKRYLLLALGVGLPGVSFFNYFSVFLAQSGYTQLAISNAYTWAGLGAIASAFVILWLSQRYGMTRLLGISLFASGVVLIPMLSLNPLWIIALSILFSLAYDTTVGLAFPVLALRFRSASGSVIMLMTLINALIGLIINVSGPFLYQTLGFRSLLLMAMMGAFSGWLALRQAVKGV
jgi:MFS transporter, YNFM family, putative membrane transport protein